MVSGTEMSETNQFRDEVSVGQHSWDKVDEMKKANCDGTEPKVTRWGRIRREIEIVRAHLFGYTIARGTSLGVDRKEFQHKGFQ